MMRISLILCLCLLFSCQGKPKVDHRPIEIYPMSGVDFRSADHYVIYHHEGKSDTAILNAVIDFNRETLSIDSLRHHEIYSRRFYKQDKDLTRDYKEDGPEAIRDYADRCIISIAWWRYKHLDSLIDAEYYIWHKKYETKPYRWSSAGPLDSLLLNPIPRW